MNIVGGKWVHRALGGTPGRIAALVAVLCALAAGAPASRASIAYGSINNFDTVNDTGTECHGFEIELEDLHSTDITYTYNWNHYGTPSITEDTASKPGHTNVIIRYMAKYNAGNSTWSAYTAVPTNAIAATDGHQFTNPNVNFGGEHFGVGYYRQATAIRYFWLQDGGSGNLVRGPQVQVATPTFVYYPPAPAQLAQVQAAIVPPPPPAPPVKEFGEASWVKEIRTTTHNNNEVKLRDLVSDDPDDPNDKNWRNGEPDEIEVEWQILQTDTGKTNGGANGELVGAPEDLNNGDEVITRRYEFYLYVGPLDEETGEAMAQSVAPDGTNGTGIYSNTVVVGEYLGSQMSAVDVDAPIGLIDHLEDGMVNTPYTPRRIVIQGNAPFTATNTGFLPAGMTFDPETGILSGTPAADGVFVFSVSVSDTNNPVITKTYRLVIAAEGQELPPHTTVEADVFPANAGSTDGSGVYDLGTNVTVVATPAVGYVFTNWTDNGKAVSTSPAYPFTNLVNRALVANFLPAPPLSNAVVTLNNLGQMYDGSGKVVTASTDPAGLTVDVTYDGSPAAPTNAGSYTVVGTVNDPDYVGSATNTLIVSAASAAVTLGNLGQTYDGSGKTATAATTPAGLTVDLTYDGSPAAPTNAGSYTVVGVVNDPNYLGSATNTLVVAPAAATVSLGNLSRLYDGTAKSVSVSTVPAGLSVIVTYNGSPDAPTNAGSYTVAGTVNELNYQGGSTQTLQITNAPPGNPAVLTVIISGGGTTTITNGTALKLGRTYSIVARPGVNNLFSNWLVSADGGPVTDESALARYTFTMRSNLTLTVNFVTNRFLDVAGKYNGLFESDTGDHGFFTARVTPHNGRPATFYGQINIDGTKTPIKGTFGLDGVATCNALDLQVTLELPFDGSGTIIGTLTNLAGTSDMLGYIADGSAAYAGQYTMVVPGNPLDSSAQPGGCGYGLLKINTNGMVKLTGGRLADAGVFKQSVLIGKGGIWPLYSTYPAGSIRGWLTVSTNGGITGTLHWGSDGTGMAYTNGFEMDSVVQGGFYSAANLAAFPTLTCGDGLLTTTVTNTAGKFTFNKSEVTRLVLTPATGRLKLDIVNGAAAGEGVVLGTNTASGYLLHSGTSSWFELQ